MSEVVTYKNDGQHCFCQVKLDSGERILISLGSGTLRISKLLLGIIPMETIWESGDAKTIMSVLLCEGQFKHPLDAAKDKAMAARSINDLRRMLA
jgi:hypothetical protein